MQYRRYICMYIFLQKTLHETNIVLGIPFVYYFLLGHMPNLPVSACFYMHMHTHLWSHVPQYAAWLLNPTEFWVLHVTSKSSVYNILLYFLYLFYIVVKIVAGEQRILFMIYHQQFCVKNPLGRSLRMNIFFTIYMCI